MTARVLSASLTPAPGWRSRLVIALVVALNVGLVISDGVSPSPDRWYDWGLWSSLPERIESGTLYLPGDRGYAFVWSPVMVPVMLGVLALGYWPWLGLHIAALLLLANPMLVAVALLSYPFWADAAAANTFTFVVVAGALAMRGSRAGSLAYFALLLLMPRPIQLPLAAWLLWKQPGIRWPFAAMFAIHALAVLASGHAGDWIAAMLSYGASELEEHRHNWSLTQFFGIGWFLAGLPLAGWLTWKGRVGFAGLALSTYLLPQYFLMLLLELVPTPYSSPSGATAVQRLFKSHRCTTRGRTLQDGSAGTMGGTASKISQSIRRRVAAERDRVGHKSASE